ncbi:GNAT family N-acetyltransferase [Nocardia sp. NPDC051570]|uniref:GNAT family N-acetyltransferase n=1 Tax=Nocardia sp. NPDC051570 TaxID=3364324 RepID=UPI0037A95A58
MTSKTGFEIHELRDSAEIAKGIALYRQVFGIPSQQCSVAPRLLTGLSRHGGFVLGAWAEDSLVAVSYGFVGFPAGELPYLYLQLIAVHAEHQGRGIGRAMMHRVAQVARQRGLRRLRWAFDPLQTRNAYFYLDVIGARARAFVADMYGVEAAGRDRRMSTHRVIAEWDLRPPVSAWRPPSAPPPVGTPLPDGQSLLLTVGTTGGSEFEPDAEAEAYRQLSRLMDRGYCLVSCRTVDSHVVARLCPDRISECLRA